MEYAAVSFWYALGFVYLRIFLPGENALLRGVLSFPIGLALWIVTLQLTLVLHLPFNVWGVSLAALGIAAGLGRFRKSRLDLCDLPVFAFVGCALLATSFLAQSFDLMVFTTDTLFIHSTGNQMAQHGQITSQLKGVLASFSSYLSFAQMAAYALGIEYFRSLLALTAVCNLVLIVLFGHRILRRHFHHGAARSWLLPSFAALILISTYPYLWSAFYPKTAIVYGFMLFLVCTAMMLAALEEQRGWLAVVVLALVSTTSMRLEAGLTTLPAIAAAVSVASVPYLVRTRLFGATALIYGGWYAFIIVKSFAHGMFSVYQLFIMGAAPGFFGVALALASTAFVHKRFPIVETIILYLPWAMIGFLILAIGALSILDIEVVKNAIRAYGLFFSNLGNGALFFWAGTLVLLVFAEIAGTRFQGEGIFAFTVFGFILVLIAIAFQTPWKHSGYHDGSNRMLIHIMPALIFYVLLKSNARLGAKGREHATA